MERERHEAIVAGLQAQLTNADTNGPSGKKNDEIESENKQLKKKITENENEIKKLKATIADSDFETRLLITKIAAATSENEHLQGRINEFDITTTELVKRAEQAGKNATVNTLTASQVLNEIAYLNNKINKLENVKGWMSLGIVLLITAVVLFFLNTAYKI